MNKHKWYNEIVAWAEGKTIQCRYNQYKSRDTSVWKDYTYSNTPSFNGDLEFRVKPNTVKYRLYLDGLDGDIIDNIIMIVSSDDNLSETVMKVESFNSTFIRWLTDWIELEIGDIK
jgi:hypothetical protein